MGFASKLRGSHFGGRSSTANSTPRQPPRNPGTRAERAAGDTSGIADNKRELAFAAVLALVGIAALYPALYYGGRSQPPDLRASKNHAMNMKNWVNFTLLETQRVAHNTRLFRFELDPKESLGVYPVSHLLLRAEVVNHRGRLEKITRSYVPISDPRARGYFDLMIKILPEGLMSQRLARLNPGDSLEMRGPVVELLYKANMRKHLGMIAGDIGITHMVQMIKDIVSNPKDNTQVSLIYETESPEDILLKKELDTLSQAHPNFKVFYTVNIGGAEWQGGLGHVTADMIYKALPHPSSHTLILVSGPPKLMDRVCGMKDKERYSGQVLGLLRQIGYKNEQVHKF
jgi:cytochrome-b5 reductase